MASEKLFEAVPAFPEHIPTASIYTVSLGDLNSEDSAAAQTLFNACQELGFFMLDLRGSELGDVVINEIDRLFRAGEEIMSLPDEVKDMYQHDIPKSFLG